MHTSSRKQLRDFQIKKCSKTEAKTLSISSLCVLCAAVAHGGNPQDRAALSLWFVSWNNLFLGSPLGDENCLLLLGNANTALSNLLPSPPVNITTKGNAKVAIALTAKCFSDRSFRQV
ncbi:MAG: hypothetical protein V7K25_20660 [Nostoc sp.]|uniref:hypothetical protein n=1 Tax=Nostoc sp. TaxID=1180 RepID=UPI002FF61A2A